MSELISGFVAPGWEAVRDQFATNIETKEDIGAGLCIFHHGEPVQELRFDGALRMPMSPTGLCGWLIADEQTPLQLAGQRAH